MIAGGDDVAKSAFRVSLREQPSSPSLASQTQELDPADILEVRDVAEAIARAEAVIRTPLPRSTGPDLFEDLARRADRVPERAEAKRERPTDDAVGPAIAAPARISTLPPPPAPAASTSSHALPTAIAEERRDAAASLPGGPILHLPVTVPGPEDDAYYHPGGRIRSLAEMTLDGYRPESTLMVRLRQRRSRLTWWVAGALVLLSTFSAAALVTPSDAEPVAKTASPAARLREADRVEFSSTPAKMPDLGATRLVSGHVAHPHGRVPVLDVKSLPRAR